MILVELRGDANLRAVDPRQEASREENVVIVIPSNRLARIVILLVPGCLLAGCQGSGSSYPLFSIPGVTRVPPPGSWQHSGDAKYYPDLTPTTSGPVHNEEADRQQGASLSWVPHGQRPEPSDGVVQATFEQPTGDRPVGSGIRENSVPRLLQPPTGVRSLPSAAKMTDQWSSRHDPH